QCLNARRRALFAMSVVPAWAISAAFLFSLWPWRPAAAHLAMLAFLGIILAEFSFDGVQKIPFTCSYLPGKSNLHLTFWLWIDFPGRKEHVNGILSAGKIEPASHVLALDRPPL